MFRQMRRKRQLLSEEATLKMLREAPSGVLALTGDNGYNYAVPLNFAYADGKIYFHVATTGHKIDAIKNNDKVSFCVIGQDKTVPEKFTSYYSSAIAFGKIRIISDNNDSEKRRGLDLLADKYCPDESAESREKEIAGGMSRLVVLVIDIEHLTGKTAKELVNTNGTE